MASDGRRLIRIMAIDPAQRMWSGRRHVLRIRLAQAAETARGFHALFKRHKPAICRAACYVVNRAPGIVLGFGAISNGDDTDANSQDQYKELHGHLLVAPAVNAYVRALFPVCPEGHSRKAVTELPGLWRSRSSIYQLSGVHLTGLFGPPHCM
jgi:hypothetical protein